MRLISLVGAATAALSVATSANAQGSGAVDAGRKLFDTRQFADAAKVLTPVGATDGNAALLLSRIAYDARNTRDAVKWGEKAVALIPDSANAHVWLGRAYLQELEGAVFFRQPVIAGRARAQYDRAVELDPNNYDAREARAKYYLNAPGIAGGGMDKARPEADIARKLNAYRGGLLRGDIEERDKKIPAAEAEFAVLVKAYPDSSAPFSRLVNLYQAARRFPEAFAAIDARAARLPSDVVAQYQTGKTAALSGDRLERGEAALRAFIAAGAFAVATEANARHRLGMILEKRGDASGALREYQTAVRLDPKLEDAKSGVKRVQAR